MKVASESVINGWQSTINGAPFGPAMPDTPALWAWQREVLQPVTLTGEQVAALAAVIEFAILRASGNNPDRAIHTLACEMFHNLNLGA